MNTNNQYDLFEKMIQEKLDLMESSHNQSWGNISKKMDKINRIKRLKKWGLISLTCIGLISVFTIGLKDKKPITKHYIKKNKNTKVETISTSSNKVNDDIIIEPTIEKKDIKITTSKNHLLFEKNNPKNEITISESKNTKEEENSPNKKNEISTLPLRNDDFIIEKSETIVEKSDSVLFISTNNKRLCAGDTLEFLFSNCNSCKLEWYINDNFHSNNSDGKFVLNGSGELSFKLIAITERDTLISNSIDVLIEDVLDLKISFQEIDENQNTKHYFSAVSSNNLNGNFLWDFGDENTSSDEHATNFYQNNGSYIVSLEYTSKFGCSNKVYKSIDVNKKTNLLAPNSFTPNGDGLNDFFMPEGLKISGYPFTLTIYNKMGQRVFESKNTADSWDGFNQKTGQKCKNDNYIWLVNTINENGDPEQFKGSILLLK